ncbi:MAG: aminotransferase class V-fold PLP-dependent enzyme [Chloroflexi bacterium]|nr:aminotransferase class V-fold PLP-dependent enzyme [Chloroflexota bacterium]
MDLTDLEHARALDRADPLGEFRMRFTIPDPEVVYLDGNSLGRPPRAALEALRRVTSEEWATELIRGWGHWLDAPLRVGDLLAPLIGARSGEVVVTDSTTVNLFRAASAALDARPERHAIAIATEEFPTARYVVEGLAAARGLEIRWLPEHPIEGLAVAEIDRVADEDLALIVLSQVNYRSAAIADLAAITARAREAGALVLWDLAHSAGAIPIDLTAGSADLAVGCTYKYLNGGPGAPGYLYVRRELQDEFRPPIQGWFAQAEQFEMGPRFERAAGIAGWLVGTPGMLGLAAAEVGIALSAEAGIDRIRIKGMIDGQRFHAISLLDAWLAPRGCTLGSPRDPGRRANHVAIVHPDARRLTAELMARSVIADFRAPNSIRIGLSPLSTSFEEVHRGLASLRELLDA